MIVLAQGAEKVNALEHALGGSPPEAAFEASCGELRRSFHARVEAQRDARAEIAGLAERTRARFEACVSGDGPGVKKDIDETRALYERRAQRPMAAPPEEPPIEPRVMAGSGFWLKTRPYDWLWADGVGGNLGGLADKLDGKYSLSACTIGEGYKALGAGIASKFFSTDGDPSQRFAALVDFADDWWDSAMPFYVAQNDLRTHLWVWGAAENRWVAQVDRQPSWSDGVSWYQGHGNDPAGEVGRISIECTFPAAPQSWYLAWVWSEGSVDADAGPFGVAASCVRLDVRVPFMVFGSL